MTKYYLYLLSILFIMSCGDDEPSLAESLRMTYEFTIDDDPITLGETYTLNGSTVMFEVANYYIHGLRFANTETGVVIASEADHLLAGVDQTANLAFSIEPTSISKTAMIIGVNEDLNAQTETDFTQRSTDDPLGLQDPSMHWNWNSGYKFIRFDGEVDTDGDGVVDTPIAYHIGSNPLRKSLELDATIDLKSGVSDLTVSFDLNRFFADVDFQIESNWDTHTGNNLELANQLFNNLDSAIQLRQ